MEISLRNKTYTAEHLTDLNYLPLGLLFIDKDGHFTIEGAENYESLPQSTKLKLVGPLMDKLSDPDEKAIVAHALISIFPSLPRELVRYNGKNDFTLNLTLTEILEVAIAVANAVPKPEGAVVDPEAMEIERLEQELAEKKALKNSSSGVGFAKK